MITPGTAPEGAYVPGASFGPDNRGVPANTAIDQAKAQLTAPYMGAFGDVGQILTDTLNGILQAVVNGIVAGAQAVGMVVTGVINTVTSAIQWVTDGIASLFGIGSETQFTVGSTLADAYDKQQELIGKVDDLMVDNAGFINLCMSKTIRVSGWQNNWLAVPFDTYVTEHKNAEIQQVYISRHTFDTVIPNFDKTAKIARAEGIKFLAPGVWNLEGQITLDSGDVNFRYIEAEVRVYEVDSATNWANSIYTVTRFATHATNNRYRSIPLSKPVIIPDDGKTYVAMIHARFQNESGWDALGGALWSSFSAFRHSADTTDYGAQDTVTAIETITE